MNKNDPSLPVELDEKVKLYLLDSLRSKPDQPGVLGYVLDGGYTNDAGEITDGIGPHISLGWYDSDRKLTGGRFYRIDDQRLYVTDITIERIRGKRLVTARKTQIIDGRPITFGYIRIVEQDSDGNAEKPPGVERES